MSYTVHIADVRRSRGVSQTELADRIGMSLSMVGKIERGQRRISLDLLTRIADALEVHPAMLMKDYHPEAHSSVAVEDHDSDEVHIQRWDISYGMGGGTYLDLPVTGDMLKFSGSWLRQFTNAPPERIFLASGTGESMFPTILDSDSVVIDTSDREVRMADRIYAAAYGQTGIIKRLRPMPDGSVKIMSDNPTVPPETAYDGELHVVGRVVAIVRKM